MFTDDDVDVAPDCLVSIHSICNKWPNHSVFGGRINVVFPVQNVPRWASNSYVFGVGFAEHNYSKEECIYGHLQTPSRANFWVKKNLLDTCRRFNEEIGSIATSMILGEDALFLRGLLDDGYEIVYSPAVVVGHRIQKKILKPSAICLRAYRLGRGIPHIYGLPQSTLLKSHPAAWRLYRCGAIIWNSFKVLLSVIFSLNENRLANCARGIRNLGLHIESMGLAKTSQEYARHKN